MINQIPETWKYNDSMEMLFLFYQCTDELLSEMTPDSYSLPQHNTLTLLYEMSQVYNLLEQYNIKNIYYQKYIPPIIEEFLSLLEDDYLLKRTFGMRLQAIRTGFQEAMQQSTHLVAWINNTNQICTPRKYLSMYKDEIIRLVTTTKDKNKLIYCITNFFVTLRWIGYSREYLYISTKK